MAKNNAKKRIKKKDTASVKNNESKNKKGIRERFTEILELPKELVLDLPKLTMIGNTDLMIENYKGIMEYGSAQVRINTSIGIIRIIGTGLLIKEITSEDIIVSGMIRSLEFLNAG